MDETVKILPLSYNNADYRTSALRLLFSLLPEWESQEGEIKLTRFTDGITNTLLKASKLRPGLSDIEIDKEAVLIRAYGKGTEIIIDREREAASHLLLAQRNLAPRLLARFQNGLIYHFIRGRVTTPQDLREEHVWRGVARRLGEWHAVLPVPDSAATPQVKGEFDNDNEVAPAIAKLAAGGENQAARLMSCGANMWNTLQRWVRALPEDSPADKDRKVMIQRELERCVAKVGGINGIGRHGLVLSHCDLLSGNVIIEPRRSEANGHSGSEALTSAPPSQPKAAHSLTNGHSHHSADEVESVCFIDYEYITPAPAAFDLANHLAEWAGFECDYAGLPTRSVRRAFIREYLVSYHSHLTKTRHPKAAVHGHGAANGIGAAAATNGAVPERELDELCAAVDAFRGVPGLYWGVWAIIQHTISQIDFDYASYADKRLAEWLVPADDADAQLRERRWAEE